MKDKFKTVVITGASSGIGLDLAKTYVELGCNLALIARNQDKLNQAADICRKLKQNEEQIVESFSVDVGDAQAIGKCVASIKGSLGAPDLLILSAGVLANQRFVDQSDEDFNSVLHTNVIGSRLVALGFVKDMIAQKHGQICFVSSLAGLISTYGYSAYNASKFAVIGMAGALRQEIHEHGVGVSVLCPPEVDTPMVAQENEHILPQTRFLKDIGGTLNVKQVTQSAVNGINKNRFIIVPGFMAKLSYAQARFMPRIFSSIIQLMIKISTKNG